MEEEYNLMTVTLDIEPTTVSDVFSFVQSVITAFEPSLFFSLTLVLGFFVAFGVRDLLLVGRRT